MSCMMVLWVSCEQWSGSSRSRPQLLIDLLMLNISSHLLQTTHTVLYMNRYVTILIQTCVEELSDSVSLDQRIHFMITSAQRTSS